MGHVGIKEETVRWQDVLIDNLEILKEPGKDSIRVRFLIHSKADKDLEWGYSSDSIPSTKYVIEKDCTPESFGGADDIKNDGRLVSIFNPELYISNHQLLLLMNNMG